MWSRNETRAVVVLRQAPLGPGNETRATAIAICLDWLTPFQLATTTTKDRSVQYTKSARGRPGKEDTGVWFPTVVERLFKKGIY